MKCRLGIVKGRGVQPLQVCTSGHLVHCDMSLREEGHLCGTVAGQVILALAGSRHRRRGFGILGYEVLDDT